MIKKNELIHTVKQMQQKDKRTAYYKALEYLCLKNGYITEEKAKQCLKDSGYSRQAISKRMKNIKEILQYEINKTE